MGIKKWHKATPPVGIERPYLQKQLIFGTLASVGIPMPTFHHWRFAKLTHMLSSVV
jgi:hypothetical protein